MKSNKEFVEINSMLVKEFDKYIIEHPDFADNIPDNALVVMQIKEDDEFNNWARETAKKVTEKTNQIVFVNITELKPVRSRIERLKLEFAA